MLLQELPPPAAEPTIYFLPVDKLPGSDELPPVELGPGDTLVYEERFGIGWSSVGARLDQSMIAPNGTLREYDIDRAHQAALYANPAITALSGVRRQLDTLLDHYGQARDEFRASEESSDDVRREIYGRLEALSFRMTPLVNAGTYLNNIAESRLAWGALDYDKGVDVWLLSNQQDEADIARLEADINARS